MRSLTPVAVALVLTALILPVSLAGTNLALGVLSVVLLLRARGEGRLLRGLWNSPIMAALAFYGIAGVLSSLFGVSQNSALRDGLKDFHRLWAVALFLWAVALEPEAPVMEALAVSFAGMAVYGACQTAFSGRPDGWILRAHGFVHPVVYGQQMALAVLGSLSLLARPGKSSAAQLRGALVLAVLTATALALSQTRMALFAMVGGFIVLCVLESRARRWAWIVAVLFLAAAVTWEFLPTGSRSLLAVLKDFKPNSPHQARWSLWVAAWRMFRDHPWTGAGPGGFKVLFPSYHSLPLDNETNWGSAHNLYLHQLAERGLLGATALAILIGVLLRDAWRAARTGTARGLWAATSVTAFLIMNMTETSFQNEQFSTLFLLCWAWGTAGLRKRG